MKRYGFFLLSLLFLAGCSREEQEFRTEGTPYFNITVQDDDVIPVKELDPMSAQYTLNLTASGYSSTANTKNNILRALRFHVRSNLRWKILPVDGAPADWIHPFPESGEKEGIFFFKTARNTDPVSGREMLYNILVDDGRGVYEPLSGVLCVRQAESPEFLETHVSLFQATAAAQTLRLRVNANVDWEYEITPDAAYATDNIDWITDESVHPVTQQKDTLVLRLSQNTETLRGARLSIKYKLDGTDMVTAIPILQYPATEVQLEGFPVRWKVRVSDNTFANTFPSDGTVPPVEGDGLITFHNEAGNGTFAVSDGSPVVTGVWPGDYCEFAAHSPVSAGTIAKLSFGTRTSSSGPRYWRMEFRDGETWKIAGTPHVAPANVKDPAGQPVIYTHEMQPYSETNPVWVNVDGIVTYTENTDRVEFRFICASSWRADTDPAGSGKAPDAPTTGTWRLSVDGEKDEADGHPYQPAIEIIAASSAPPAQARLSVSKTHLLFDANAFDRQFEVSTDQNFLVKSEQSWIHIVDGDRYAGEKVGVQVVCDPNTGVRSREGVVTVVSGITRQDIPVIQVGGGTVASFPLRWTFPAPSSQWVEEEDYHLEPRSGSWVYSDTHAGLLSLTRYGEAPANAPTYKNEGDLGVRLLSYGVYENDYWQMSAFIGNQSAGNYTLEYQTTASNAGPKYFRLEYSLDYGSTWTPVNTKSEALTYKDGSPYDGGTPVTYTYRLSDTNNETFTVRETFRLPSMSNTVLKIRAVVACKIKHDNSGDMTNDHHGGSHRIGGHITLSYEKPGSDEPASFPIQWSFPAAESVAGSDYSLNNTSGSFVWSDTHEGKLTVIRTSTSEANSKNTTYVARSTSSEPRWNGKHCLLHYGIYKGDYWLFEAYRVDNPAGTYTLEYCVESSGSGPKYFALEYSTDGSSWTFIDGRSGSFELPATESSEAVSETFNYTYAIETPSIVQTIRKSFSPGAVNGTLSVRARVVSVCRADDTKAMTVNHGGTNRVGDHINLSFVAD